VLHETAVPLKERSDLLLFSNARYNTDIFHFSYKYEPHPASKYITCYLTDFRFHTNIILRTFGNIEHPPSPKLVR
jgi:hypothetical protein